LFNLDINKSIEYGLPIDEQELDRIDMSHAKCLMILEKKLFLAPMTKNPQRILDLGTGTGWISSSRTLSLAEIIFRDLGY
jgi:ubiquinone/menaquinone biosynthesis C-methylase UbiE